MVPKSSFNVSDQDSELGARPDLNMSKADSREILRMVRKYGANEVINRAHIAIRTSKVEAIESAVELIQDLADDSDITTKQADMVQDILEDTAWHLQTRGVLDSKHGGRIKSAATCNDGVHAPTCASHLDRVNEEAAIGGWGTATAISPDWNVHSSTADVSSPRKVSTVKKSGTLSKAFERIEKATAELRIALTGKAGNATSPASLASPFNTTEADGGWHGDRVRPKRSSNVYPWAETSGSRLS